MLSRVKHDHVDELQAEWVAQGADLRPDLDPEALGVVLRVQALAREFMAQAETALAEFDLNWWQYDVLSALLRQGPPYTLSASDLAAQASLTSGAMTTRIDGLLAAGLVTRVRDTKDRRRVLVSLTKTGQQRVTAAAEARFNAAVAAQAGLSKAQRVTLNDLLRELLAQQS